MSDLLGNTGTAGTTTTTPATTAPATTTGAGSSGSFPASEMGGLSGPTDAFAKQILSQTPTEFFSEYQITTSNDEPLYEDPSNANQLNNNAVWLAWYANLGVTDRQDLQDAMVTLGSLTTAQATGGYNSTTIGAFQKALGDSSSVNSNVLDYLNNADSGIASLQEQIATAKTKEETAANAPITAAVSPKATLAASITSAFDQALGFTPANIQSQVNDFIDQIQGQEVSESAGGQERAQANAQIAQADDESSELNKLGTDGVDTVLQAYAAAVSGTKLPGAGTPQGPVTGTVTAPGAINPNPSGMIAGPTTATTKQVPNEAGVIGALKTDLNPMTLLHPTGTQLEMPGTTTGGTHPVTTFGPGQMQTAPNPAVGTPGTTPVHGGTYALTPAQWAEAQTLSPTLKTYVSKTPAAATAAGASPGMQQTAAQALLLNNYDSTGSMSAAVTALANGGPVAKAEGSHMSAFATSVANEVNSQITAIQNQVNNSTTTTTIEGPTSQTDIDAEAAQEAKQADPAGYYAANYASWGSQLSKMLYGTPLTNMETTADTFTGPVGSDTALTGASGTSTTTTPAPATTAA